MGSQYMGIPIERVELSFDDGITWTTAKITQKEDKSYPENRVFSWVLWEYEVDPRKFV